MQKTQLHQREPHFNTKTALKIIKIGIMMFFDYNEEVFLYLDLNKYVTRGSGEYS